MKIWREPLVHFVILGGVLFAVAGQRQGVVVRAPVEVGAAQIQRVTVSKQTQQALMVSHKAKTGQSPTTQELEALVEDWVGQEILYREALRLGLDRDDLIVRRRLIQKMLFALEGLSAVRSPDDAAVRAYIEANPDPFMRPARVSFEHRFYADTEPEAQQRAAAAVLALGQGKAPPPSQMFVHGERFESSSALRIQELMGGDFVGSLQGQPVGVWSGPVRSGFGWHAVRLISVQPPTLSEQAHEQARRKLTEAASAQAAKEAIAGLRAGYDVVVEVLP